MEQDPRVLAAAGAPIAALTLPDASFAQKFGGTLKVGHFDSPASVSMLKESTVAVNLPTMGACNICSRSSKTSRRTRPSRSGPSRHRAAL